ncbi:hypothetical protein [Burkholderia cenocepacia]|uniref:hypothetical protein n=1 Tax=Burkholderia cenocepacia TaxID=95486 RepID=UPI001B8FDDFF|nr:hypothetical protein [Burkholderia cenocepacia]MBR8405473.1 hypothetical protein [Burkholderia cenocepacia]MDN7640674.1 hypothetical protein [Burkholderia cenocepacia]
MSGSVTGGTLGATSGAVAAGIGGAAGALASQGVMIAGGEQHGLNFASITLGAISAGVTAGIGAAAGAPGSAWSAAAQGAVRSAATQGIGVVTGLQERFDWKGVAASAIASGVGYGVGEQVGKTVIGAGVGADLGRFASGVAGGLSAGVASTLVRGGSLGRNIGAIAADAVASTVGNMVLDNVQAGSVGKNGTGSLYGVTGDVDGMVGDAIRYQPTSENLFSMPVAPSPYSNASVLYGLGGGIPAAPTPLAAQPYVASFGEPNPGVQVADASELFGRLAQDSSARTAAMMSAYQVPRLDPQAGQPKLVPLDAAASRASSDAAFMRFMETQGSQPIGGLMANAAIQATGNARYAGLVADAAGPLDALWAPGGVRSNSLASVRRGANVANSTSLLPTEGNVATYSELVAAGGKGDNITPHHIPSANFMSQYGVAKSDGIAINMEQPFPGVGGRHRETFTYGTTADLGMAPRDALAAGIRDARQIYQRDGLYPEIRPQLQEVIRQNLMKYPNLFGKQ